MSASGAAENVWTLSEAEAVPWQRRQLQNQHPNRLEWEATGKKKSSSLSCAGGSIRSGVDWVDSGYYDYYDYHHDDNGDCVDGNDHSTDDNVAAHQSEQTKATGKAALSCSLSLPSESHTQPPLSSLSAPFSYSPSETSFRPAYASSFPSDVLQTPVCSVSADPYRLYSSQQTHLQFYSFHSSQMHMTHKMRQRR